jgi:hypothetical protein
MARHLVKVVGREAEYRIFPKLARKSSRADSYSGMSFSLRRWINHATAPSPEFAPTHLTPTGQAQFLKGLSFANGAGGAQDYAQAAQCYTEAAEQGHSVAQLNLAALYERGQGVTRDQAKALIWLTKAANRGNSAAQYRLGLHEHLAWRTGQAEQAVEGRVEALKWLRLSAAQGFDKAEGACEFLALAMTRDEVAEAGRRCAAFLPPKLGT